MSESSPGGAGPQPGQPLSRQPRAGRSAPAPRPGPAAAARPLRRPGLAQCRAGPAPHCRAHGPGARRRRLRRRRPSPGSLGLETSKIHYEAWHFERVVERVLPNRKVSGSNLDNGEGVLYANGFNFFQIVDGLSGRPTTFLNFRACARGNRMSTTLTVA